MENSKLERLFNIAHNPYIGWLVLIISSTLTLAAYYLAEDQLEVRSQERFEFRAQEIADRIEARMLQYEQVLWGGVGLMNASTFVDRDEWRNYYESIKVGQNLPGMQSFGYSIPLSPDERQKHIEDLRMEGFVHYEIKPKGERSSYSAIIYIEPFDWRNQRALGFDGWSESKRRLAMKRARDSGEAASTGAITLVQEVHEDIQKGFVMFLPVYKQTEEAEAGTVSEKTFIGWIFSTFRIRDLMAGILGENPGEIRFEIFEGRYAVDKYRMHQSHSELISEQNTEQQAVVDIVKTMQGQDWLIRFGIPRSAMLSPFESAQSNYILAAGIIIDVLLFYIIISFTFVNRHAKSRLKQVHDAQAKSQRTLAQQANELTLISEESKIFFELAPDAFMVVSHRGIILRANRIAHTMFGFPDGTLVNVRVDQLIPPALHKRHPLLRKAFVMGEEGQKQDERAHHILQKKDGSTFEATVKLVPVDTKKGKQVVASVHDISTTIAIEKQLSLAKEKAESMSRAKSNFVATMSHEMRTPLNAMLGSTQMLDRLLDTPEQKKYCHMLSSAGTSLLNLINEVLDYSKVEAGQVRVVKSYFNLEELLSSIGYILMQNHSDKDLELAIICNLPTHCRYFGDKLRIQQVLTNFISNALKFTQSGSITIRVEPYQTMEGRHVFPILESEEELSVSISVQDTGMGISALQMSKLFNLFSQADESINRNFGGTGLGLALSKELVRLMGGNLRVKTTLGEGSTFCFSLDLPQQCDGVIQATTCPISRLVLVDLHGANQEALHSLVEHLESPLPLVSIKGFQPEILQQMPQYESIVILDAHHARCQSAIKQWLLAGAEKVIVLANALQKDALLNIQKSNYEKVHFLAKPVLKDPLVELLTSFTHDGPSEVAEPEKEESEDTHCHGLLVDDVEFNRAIGKALLEECGVSVDLASGGREAIEKFKSGTHYDLIFMDIQMPEMDGIETTRILLGELDCDIPIIAMTASITKEQQESYIKEGMVDMVAKPVDLQNLAQVIAKHTKSKSSA